jgi:hypothetical protein
MRIVDLLPAGFVIAIFFILTGCTGGAVVQDPRTGQRLDCGTEGIDLDPWSQTDRCIADHLAQGWTVEERH